MAIFKKRAEKTLVKRGAKPVKKEDKVVKAGLELKPLKAIGRPAKYLVKPVISEKSTMVNALNKYVFEVSIDANKVEIKKAIQELYNVRPISVNIINSAGKSVRSGRNYGQTKKVKKAIVTLKKGDSIKLYEGI
ncbi:MAG: 50S ribosomal protein L23 [Patescibacteria group bacterium]|jgi:large subunit ribosomal protein L23